MKLVAPRPVTVPADAPKVTYWLVPLSCRPVPALADGVALAAAEPPSVAGGVDGDEDVEVGGAVDGAGVGVLGASDQRRAVEACRPC